MLREHGAHRPSVFEILNHVHRLRGTQSRFTYNAPPPQPLAPRQQVSSPSANPLDNLVSFRPAASPATNSPSSKNAGVQAREKVLEAIAPMRRGRPVSTSAHTPPESKSRPDSPHKEKAQQNKVQSWLDDGFAAEEDKAWKEMKSGQAGNAPIRGHRSGAATVDVWKVRNPITPAIDSAWSTDTRAKDPARDMKLTLGDGFGDDFAEKLWDSIDGSSKDRPVANGPKPLAVPARPQIAASDSTGSYKVAVARKGQDAFEGLGLSSSDKLPPQTLGEARKLRTGLAAINGTGNLSTSSLQVTSSLQGSRPSSSLAPRPTPSPRQPQFSPAPIPSSSSWKRSASLTAQKPSSAPTGEASVATRFPSLEELDATFSPSLPDSNGPSKQLSSRPQPPSEKVADISSPPLRPRMNSNTSGNLRIKQQSYSKDGVRSQQVTGVAMRELKGTKGEGMPRRGLDDRADASDGQLKRSRPLRPSLSRKHRSNITIKQTHLSGNDVLGSPNPSTAVISPSPQAMESKDWLTGDDDAPVMKEQPAALETPVLREFTNKRSSFIESGADVPSPQEAVPAELLPSVPSPPSPTKPKFAAPRASRPVHTIRLPQDIPDKPADVQPPPTARIPATREKDKVESSSDEGPEDVNGFTPPRQLKRRESKKRKGRQSSVHDLVDLWGGGVVHLKEKEKEKEVVVRTPIAGDYMSHGSETYAQPPQRRSSFLPSSSNPRSTSPQPMPSSPTAQSPRPNRPQRSPSYHRKLSSAATKPSPSPAQSPSSRGRPQSMFVFPVGGSKSDSTSALTSPMLSPPTEPTPSRTRTTSITDMVQRYEAIGGKSKGPASPTAPQKPAALKVATHNTSSGSNPRQPKISLGHSPVAVRGNGRADMPPRVPDDVAVARQRATGLSMPTGLPSTSSSGHRESIWTREVEYIGAPPRRSSPEKPLVISDEQPVSDRQSSQFSLPSRKPAAPAEESQSPPSPDKPYMGVGKLIDQWQRKTATVVPESDSSPRRSGFVKGGAGRGRA